MPAIARRDLLRASLPLGVAAVVAGPLVQSLSAAAGKPGLKMAFGMVTYQWGKDWDLPTLLANCARAGILGVELRTGHAHKVERDLSPAQRAEVKKRFADSPVALVGLGTAEEYHHPDPAALAKAIEATKEFIQLSHDVGGSGVKVRPNDLPKNVPQEKTIEQIGKALDVVAAFGADYGQQIRLEVHGLLAIADHQADHGRNQYQHCGSSFLLVPGVSSSRAGSYCFCDGRYR